MKLKLALPQTNQSWTLKPGRSYTIGTGPGCAITLPPETGLSARHVTLSYDEGQMAWKVQDVSQGAGVYVNGVATHECWIDRRIKIDLAHKLTLIAGVESPTPNLATPPPMLPIPAQDPQYPTTYPAPPPPSLLPLPDEITPATQPLLGRGRSSLPVLTWKDYVHRQVESKPNGLEKLATWFHLTKLLVI